MLGRDETRHILSDDEDKDIQIGDIVSVLWLLPNGKFMMITADIFKGLQFHTIE